MAKCNNCGKDSPRVRTIFEVAGKRLTVPKDECPYCSDDFQKITMPSEQKIWIGPEYQPNAYEKRTDEHGDVYFEAKPEFIAEQEHKAFYGSDAALEEFEARKKAEDEKRRTRRTAPLSQEEIARLLELADKQIRPLIEDQETTYEV